VFFFYRSRMGVAMRAVSYDQEAAMAQGINVGRVFAIAWAAGAVLATLGGIFATQPPLSQTGAVGPETAFVAFRALPAVILGGLDSVQGALLGGLTIGLAEIMAGQYLADYSNTLGSGYTLIVPYVVMIIGLLVRPYGMFGTPEVRRV
jgi:branched-chain amino acid transport system permease protein